MFDLDSMGILLEVAADVIKEINEAGGAVQSTGAELKGIVDSAIDPDTQASLGLANETKGAATSKKAATSSAQAERIKKNTQDDLEFAAIMRIYGDRFDNNTRKAIESKIDEIIFQSGKNQEIYLKAVKKLEKINRFQNPKLKLASIGLREALIFLIAGSATSVAGIGISAGFFVAMTGADMASKYQTRQVKKHYMRSEQHIQDQLKSKRALALLLVNHFDNDINEMKKADDARIRKGEDSQSNMASYIAAKKAIGAASTLFDTSMNREGEFNESLLEVGNTVSHLKDEKESVLEDYQKRELEISRKAQRTAKIKREHKLSVDEDHSIRQAAIDAKLAYPISDPDFQMQDLFNMQITKRFSKLRESKIKEIEAKLELRCDELMTTKNKVLNQLKLDLDSGEITSEDYEEQAEIISKTFDAKIYDLKMQAMTQQIRLELRGKSNKTGLEQAKLIESRKAEAYNALSPQEKIHYLENKIEIDKLKIIALEKRVQKSNLPHIMQQLPGAHKKDKKELKELKASMKENKAEVDKLKSSESQQRRREFSLAANKAHYYHKQAQEDAQVDSKQGNVQTEDSTTSDNTQLEKQGVFKRVALKAKSAASSTVSTVATKSINAAKAAKVGLFGSRSDKNNHETDQNTQNEPGKEKGKRNK